MTIVWKFLSMAHKREIRRFPDGRICAVTPDHPRGLKGVVAVCLTGYSDNLKEEAIPVNQLPPIVTDIPDDWKEALESKGFKFPKPKPVRKPRLVPVVLYDKPSLETPNYQIFLITTFIAILTFVGFIAIIAMHFKPS